MVAKVYGIDGAAVREIELADEVFGVPVSTGSIYHALRNELANRRVGTASTKTRGQVRGSTAKPWRQKGTGRARAGQRRSPLWKGGGVVFGPKPRDYGYKLPRKLKRLAMKSILSQKNGQERLTVVEDFRVETGKTKDLVKILRVFLPEQRTRAALVVPGDDPLLYRSGRNIPGLSILAYNRLSACQLFYAGKVLLFAEAALKLNEFYAEGKAAARAEQEVS
jgi:large subunit ribosomal protein L4